MNSLDVGGHIVSYSPHNHSGTKLVDLTVIGERPTSLASRKVWQKVLEQLKNEEMPPEAPLPTTD